MNRLSQNRYYQLSERLLVKLEAVQEPTRTYRLVSDIGAPKKIIQERIGETYPK